jgi:hypothetical protein
VTRARSDERRGARQKPPLAWPPKIHLTEGPALMLLQAIGRTARVVMRLLEA